MDSIEVKAIIRNALGDAKDADTVIALVEAEEQKNAIKMPNQVPVSMTKDKTQGDWRLASTGTGITDTRPLNNLTYPIIRDMMKTGVIRFALDMKRAQMTMPFRNTTSIQVDCEAEQNFGRAVEAQMKKILPQMMFEASYSALVHGSAFMEVPFEILSPYELGISKTKSSTMYSLPKTPNLVPHWTVSTIYRKKDGSFDGFGQNSTQAYWVLNTLDTEIRVMPDSALVIPYNGYHRNLWGESFLKPIYPLWFWYETIVRAAVQFVQMMGDPPRIGKAPSRKKVRISNSTSELIDAIDYLLALSANLPKTNSIVIPSDLDENGKAEWELGYLTMPDRSQPFVQIIELFNTLILRAALTGDRSTSQPSGDAGSRAIGEVHAEATALHNDMIVQNWLHYINTYLMPVISKLNFGSEAPPLTLKLQTVDPRQREFLNNLMGIAGNSASFQEFFYRANWEAIGRMAGLPMLTEEQARELKQTLDKESLEKQKATMEIQQESTMNPAENKEQKEVNKKIEELAAADNIPLFFSQDELFDMMFTEEQKQDLLSQYAQEGSVELFNPFHSKSDGRFASKESMGGSTGKLVANTGKMFKSGIHAAMVVEANNWDDAQKYSGIKDKNWLGAYNTGKGSITTSPEMAKWPKEMRDKVIIHETIHSRKREDGGKVNVRTDYHVALEEGCTELMTYGMTRNTKVPSPYVKEMAAVAGMARKTANGDPKRAWAIVSQLHFYNNSDAGVATFLSNGGDFHTYRGAEDINWLLGSNMPTKLEVDSESEFVAVFRQSEAVIYSTIRKPGNETEIDTEDVISLENDPIQLFNKYHDSAGRFASTHTGTAVSIARDVTATAIKKGLPGPIGHVIGAKVAAKVHDRMARIDKERLSEIEYKAKYQSLPGFAKDMLLNPAEAFSRKDDRHAKAARYAIEFGSDIAIRAAVRSTLYGSASSVGSVATAAIFAYLVGSTAPAWAIAVGGALAGASAYMVTSSLLDYGTSQLLGAWVDSASPKDRHHIRLGGFDGAKHRAKSRGVVSALEWAPILINGPIGILAAIGGESLGLGIDAYQLIGAASSTELEVSRKDYDKNVSARLFSQLLYPHVIDLLLYEDAAAVAVPIVNENLKEFGFEEVNDKMVIHKNSVLTFAENWSTGTFPSINDIGWGDTTLRINGERV